MPAAPKLSPEPQPTLAGLLDAIVACHAAAATTTAEWATQIGAEGYGRVALEGAAVARSLISAPGGAHA